jgi:hypothetical protein
MPPFPPPEPIAVKPKQFEPFGKEKPIRAI